MNHYFLHIDSGPDQQRDEQGSDFADDWLALGQAALAAGELLRGGVGAGGDACVTITVEDERHRTIGTVDARLSLAAAEPARPIMRIGAKLRSQT